MSPARDPLELSLPCGQRSITGRPDPFFPSPGGKLEVYLDVELGIDSGEQGTVQEFHSPGPVNKCCCCEFELGEHHHSLSSVDGHRQGPSRFTSQLVNDHLHLKQEQTHNCSSSVGERRNSHVCSRQMHRIELGKINTMSLTTATAEYCSSMMLDRDQEERERTTLVESLSGCNGSYDLGLPRSNGGTNNNPNCTKYSTYISSGASPDGIECFDVADISAACQLLEMSAGRHSAGGVRDVEQSQQQPDHSCENFFRVSDFNDKIYKSSTRASQPVSERRDMVEKISSAQDNEAAVSAVQLQETRAACGATSYDSTTSSASRDRPPRIELTRTYGKKRIKPKKDERVFHKVFRTNIKDFGADNYDILDRPLRKRQYKSLRQLLEIS